MPRREGTGLFVLVDVLSLRISWGGAWTINARRESLDCFSFSQSRYTFLYVSLIVHRTAVKSGFQSREHYNNISEHFGFL